MRFLTRDQWQSWCVERQVPLREAGWIRPDIGADHFHIADVPYQSDSGAKVSLARYLFSLVASGPETLVLVDDCAVWPSSQHMPLFTRFREALGESRPVIEAPGHLVTPADTDDAISIVATSLLFIWDCYGISSTGRDAFYISHDEYCYFASRDASVAERVASELAAT
ncbi:MAG: hypothetical protein QOH06_752 [Acidobacteriota bacterium]|nr:hypothetical protein [Acidobacteriota bacterium]